MGFGFDDVASIGADLYGAYESNERNASAAKLAYKRQLYMSNTAVQRRVADLKAAGLNPMLAYSDAAASAGVQQAHPAQAPTSGQRVLELQRLKKEQEVAQSQIEFNRASARNQDSQAGLNAQRIASEVATAFERTSSGYQAQATIDHIRQMIKESVSRTGKTNVDIDLGRQQFERRMHEIPMDLLIKELSLPGHRQESDMRDGLLGPLIPYLEALAPGLATALFVSGTRSAPPVRPRGSGSKRRKRGGP